MAVPVPVLPRVVVYLIGAPGSALPAPLGVKVSVLVVAMLGTWADKLPVAAIRMKREQENLNL